MVHLALSACPRASPLSPLGSSLIRGLSDLLDASYSDRLRFMVAESLMEYYASTEVFPYLTAMYETFVDMGNITDAGTALEDETSMTETGLPPPGKLPDRPQPGPHLPTFRTAPRLFNAGICWRHGLAHRGPRNPRQENGDGFCHHQGHRNRSLPALH